MSVPAGYELYVWFILGTPDLVLHRIHHASRTYIQKFNSCKHTKNQANLLFCTFSPGYTRSGEAQFGNTMNPNQRVAVDTKLTRPHQNTHKRKMKEDEIRTWYLCRNMWGHWKVNTGQRIAFLSGLYALPIWSQQVGHLWNLNPKKPKNIIKALKLDKSILGERNNLSFSHRISTAQQVFMPRRKLRADWKPDLPDVVFCCHFLLRKLVGLSQGHDACCAPGK